MLLYLYEGVGWTVSSHEALCATVRHEEALLLEVLSLEVEHLDGHLVGGHHILEHRLMSSSLGEDKLILNGPKRILSSLGC